MMLLMVIIYKIQNLKKTYYNVNDDITLNKTSHSYSNDTVNLTKTNRLLNITDYNYYTEKSIIKITSLITLHDITITSMNIM